jgi:hypothetical protein
LNNRSSSSKKHNQTRRDCNKNSLLGSICILPNISFITQNEKNAKKDEGTSTGKKFIYIERGLSSAKSALKTTRIF